MENWKEDILNSMKGAQKAAPDPKLFEAILIKLGKSEPFQVVRRPYVALAAASLALLITANIWAVSNGAVTVKTETSGYSVEQGNFNLY